MHISCLLLFFIFTFSFFVRSSSSSFSFLQMFRRCRPKKRTFPRHRVEKKKGFAFHRLLVGGSVKMTPHQLQDFMFFDKEYVGAFATTLGDYSIGHPTGHRGYPRIAWGWHGDCMGIAWGLDGDCLGIAWGFHVECMGMAWGLQ